MLKQFIKFSSNSCSNNSLRIEGKVRIELARHKNKSVIWQIFLNPNMISNQTKVVIKAIILNNQMRK